MRIYFFSQKIGLYATRGVEQTVTAENKEFLKNHISCLMRIYFFSQKIGFYAPRGFEQASLTAENNKFLKNHTNCISNNQLAEAAYA
jgi:lipid-binding SYLF domain-containing protein